MPEGLDAAETFLFLSLRNLYSYARREGMEKERGAREKNEVLKQYEQFNLWEKIVKEHWRKEREYEAAFEAFAQEPTWENADALHRAWFRCGIKTRKPETEEERDGLG